MRPRASTTSPSSRAVDELDASVVALGTKAVPRDEAEGREPRGWRRWNFGKLGARERRGNSEPDYGEQACGSPCLDACLGDHRVDQHYQQRSSGEAVDYSLELTGD